MRYIFADCVLDTQLSTLHRAGTAIRLQPTVCYVLQYLLDHRDHVVTKDELGAHVWPGQFISEATLEGCVMLARQALGDSGRALQLIQSRRGYGYRFVGVVAVEGLAASAPPLQEGPSLAAAEAEDDPPRPLVWASLARAAVVSPPVTGQTAPTSAGPPVQDPASLARATGPGTPVAERRQLTVLFCDLVDSTVLATQLDPEDLREVVRAYHQTCAAVIQRFDGTIAQYLGDGLLVYFGYPQAHEDDAQRAVRAGLGMVEALGQLNTRLRQEWGVELAVRLGCHTGLVVVGDVGGGLRQEQLALGAPPHVAARLQGFATPNTLVISAATLHLLGGFFACQPLGTPLLKGLAQPLPVYRVLYERRARSRLEALGSTGLTPLVGREQEIGLLRERWAQVKNGRGQVVLLSGEGGIGKSRLVQVLKAQVATEPQAWLTLCQCSPYSRNTALYPMIDMLERVALRFEREESPPLSAVS